MRVLITGNMGYVGPGVVRHLVKSSHEFKVIGFDTSLFGHCLTTNESLPERMLIEQRFGDVRNIQTEDLIGIDAVVHLAALSNDPMGKQFETVTDDINHTASVRLASLCAKAGVKAFVFASSCSVYGFAGDGRARTEKDSVEPLTAYARSKIDTEQSLARMDHGAMTVSCLRFATACGMSDRLRLDLVVNDFVACALSSSTITVLSDGSPWRPLIDVKDMARAIEWAILRAREPNQGILVVNVGSEKWNYQVRDLAQAVAASIPGTTISININAPPDRRSYKVDFSLFQRLAPDYQPIQTLDTSIVGLRDGLRSIGFQNLEFRDSNLIRLRVLERHQSAGRIDQSIRWTI
ncbi:SDR family oxidoreductase [Methylobacterium sp. WL8]|uniref:NAD-dependent epimerase/dehydratase family protein n=1 Tax=Methylobacterium sp. WL8 TaxID=2603899 RepID=UPI0011CA6C1D|nr:SDR family oxidoreductase [Methylobacterium sp. WL8]TXN75902.1 SDR family oxidoreductase [Methylobacterium sp. WL8]